MFIWHYGEVRGNIISFALIKVVAEKWVKSELIRVDSDNEFSGKLS